MLRVLTEADPERQSVDELRAKIEKLEQQLDEIRGARLPADEAAARFAAALEHEREHARGQLRYFAAPGAPELPTLTFGILAELVPDLIERAHEFFERDDVGGEPGMPADKRAKKVSSLQKQLTDLKREELAAVLELEQRGLIVELREEPELEAILAVWDGG